jgi:hypothetical protein
MKPQHWLPPLVFLGTAVPTVFVLHVLDVGGEFRIFIALGVGAIATAWTQSRLRRKPEGPGP